jgi:hypothetical protein
VFHCSSPLCQRNPNRCTRLQIPPPSGYQIRALGIRRISARRLGSATKQPTRSRRRRNQDPGVANYCAIGGNCLGRTFLGCQFHSRRNAPNGRFLSPAGWTEAD